ncbi:Chromosome partition protein Smc [invertebrate metagenome]|uniref:Chromosome partition protein Smc n=1 Tax=invertebrate metagenome TaxID=1711999 RepID=A0A2H9TCK7_9ZZZZ
MSSEVMKNLFRLLCILWRRRVTIVLPVFIMPFIGLLASFITSSVYIGHTTLIMPDTSVINPVDEKTTTASQMKERQAELRILFKSRHVLAAVIQELELVEADSSQKVFDKKISELAKSLSIVFGGELVKIYYQTSDQENIEPVLSSLTRHFVSIAMAPEKSMQSSSVDFLEKQLKRLSDKMRVSEMELTAHKTRYATALPQLQQSNIVQLEELKKLLAEKQTQLAGAEASTDEFNNNLANTDPLIGKVEEKLLAVRAELSMLTSRYTDQHSKVQTVRSELGRLERERDKMLNDKEQMTEEDIERLWNLATTSSTLPGNDDGSSQRSILASQLSAVQDANARLSSLKSEVESLEQQIEDMEQKVMAFSDVERELNALERNYEIKKKLYEDFEKRYEMARVKDDFGLDDSIEKVQVIDAPFTPSHSNRLPWLLFLIAGVLAGIGLGTGLAVILEVTDSTVRWKDTLEELADIPVITRLPVVPDAPKITWASAQELPG